MQIKHLNYAVGTIDKKKLAAAVLDVQLCNDEADVLGHIVGELHLNLLAEFFSFVAHDELDDRLIAHVGRPVDLNAKFFYLSHAVVLSQLEAWLDQSQVSTDVLEDADARLLRRPVPVRSHDNHRRLI
jgi:hypothetical protein